MSQTFYKLMCPSGAVYPQSGSYTHGVFKSKARALKVQIEKEAQCQRDKAIKFVHLLKDMKLDMGFYCIIEDDILYLTSNECVEKSGDQFKELDATDRKLFCDCFNAIVPDPRESEDDPPGMWGIYGHLTRVFTENDRALLVIVQRWQRLRGAKTTSCTEIVEFEVDMQDE